MLQQQGFTPIAAVDDADAEQKIETLQGVSEIPYAIFTDSQMIREKYEHRFNVREIKPFREYVEGFPLDI